MRIYLIPLTSKRALVYGRRTGSTLKPTLLDRLSSRAGQAWLKMEQHDKGWQKKLTDAGNKLFQRISYEEWSLKSIPALTNQARESASSNTHEKIPVIYPPSIVKASDISPILHRLGTEKNEMHRKKLWWSLIGLPITAPLGIIPIIPNIPFFYLAFRAYSHWKALKGAEHLEFLVKNNLIEPQPSTNLDRVYDENPENGGEGEGSKLSVEGLKKTLRQPEDKKAEGAEEERMLIMHPHAKRVAEVLETPQLVVEVERACGQVNGILEEAKKKAAEEKKATQSQSESSVTPETSKQKTS